MEFTGLSTPGNIPSSDRSSDGYAGWDTALSRRWKLPFEGHSLQSRWEVFNVPNLVRFNIQSVNLSPSLQPVC